MTHREAVPAWRGDWRSRIEERLRDVGHDTVRAFFEANPGLSYSDLAKVVGPTGDVAPVQLEQLHGEMVDQGEMARREALLDSLSRFLRGALPKGWGAGGYWQSGVTGALSSWTVLWGSTEELRQVKKKLFEKAPPSGWVPEPSNDPLLRQILDEVLYQ